MICAFHPVYTLLGAPETSYHYNRCARYGRAAEPARRGLLGEDYPVSCVFTRASCLFTRASCLFTGASCLFTGAG
jgi:hypothetical protein